MPIPLPNLDDRRWADLVEQGRALIPLYAPEWTDHNASDPGVTLMELFAFVAEMDLYQLNRIPDAHKRRLLALMGVRQQPPKPARGVVELRQTAGVVPVELPAGTEFKGLRLDNASVKFRGTGAVSVARARLSAIQWRDGAGFHNATAAWERREAFVLFGEQPTAGAELYLGFDEALPEGAWVNLHFQFAQPRTGLDERRRVLEEARAAVLPPHHSAQLDWEALGAGGWMPIEVADDTRAFSLSGLVRLRVGGDMTPAMRGKASRPLSYVRVRLQAGSFDAPPKASRVLMNAVELEQAAPLWQSWPIAKGAAQTGSAAAGDRRGVRFELNAGAITSLALGTPATGEPEFTVLAYTPSTASTEGMLILEAMVLRASGEPDETLVLPRHPVVEGTFQLHTLAGTAWREWKRVDDFAASGRAGANYRLDPTAGELTCGDGEHGRTFERAAMLFVTGEATLGAAGGASVSAVADSPHNGAFVTDPNFGAVSIGEQIAPAGGEDAESLAHAIGRAIVLREARLRAVTAEDFEALALETPGTQIARAAAKPNLFPGLNCVRAPGVVTVIIVPAMAGPRPSPSSGLVAAVSAWLERRRMLGTRVVVVGPEYVEVAVKAKVRSLAGVDKARLRGQVAAAVDAFFHPLQGGPDKTGWPFGRDVYRSEVLQVMDDVPGVDHVLSLELAVGACAPTCGNLCLGPTALVAAGAHKIEVL